MNHTDSHVCNDVTKRAEMKAIGSNLAIENNDVQITSRKPLNHF